MVSGSVSEYIVASPSRASALLCTLQSGLPLEGTPLNDCRSQRGPRTRASTRRRGAFGHDAALPRYTVPGEPNKAHGSLVTEVDEAAEDAIRAIVARERPRDAFLGEERGETGSGPRRWIVDAIDGTLSFAAGTNGWGTFIALEHPRPRRRRNLRDVAVGKRYWATRGGGVDVSRAQRAQRAPRGQRHDRSSAVARCFVPPAMWVRTDAARAMSSALARGHASVRAGRAPALEIAAGRGDLCGSSWPARGSRGAIARRRRGRRPLYGLAGGGTLTGGAVFSNGRLHDATFELLQTSRKR